MFMMGENIDRYNTSIAWDRDNVAECGDYNLL